MHPLRTMIGFSKSIMRAMVINGIDLQTNSHTTRLHNWSGRNAEGYPGLTACSLTCP